MHVVALAASVWLSSVLLATGCMKLARYRRSRALLVRQAALPERLAIATGLFLPWAEIGCGVAILWGGTASRVGGAGAAALGTGFAYTTIRLLRRENRSPCGCTGSARDEATALSVLRALAVVGVGLAVALPSAGGGLLPVAGRIAVPMAAVTPAAALALRAWGARRSVRAGALRRAEERERAVSILAGADGHRGRLDPERGL